MEVCRIASARPVTAKRHYAKFAIMQREVAAERADPRWMAARQCQRLLIITAPSGSRSSGQVPSDIGAPCPDCVISPGLAPSSVNWFRGTGLSSREFRVRARVRWFRASAVEPRRCVSLLLPASCQAETASQEIPAIMSSIPQARRAAWPLPAWVCASFRKETLHNHKLCIRTLM